MLDHAWLAARLPHQADMCLLDTVDDWSAERILCRATSHRRSDHPLRADGRLGAAGAVEYAAQAMAAHGALLAGSDGRPRAGYLVSLRSVDLAVERLDDVADDLEIVAERLSGDGNNVLYAFAVRADGRPLATGRAAVILDAGALPAEPA